MKENEEICCPQTTAAVITKKDKKYGIVSFLSTALLIVLPKCPFCVAAYSGAILLFFDIDNAALIPFFTHLKPLLGLTILGLIVFNYKKEKSPIAITLAVVALLLLIGKIYAGLLLVSDTLIYLIFLFGAWYNGNFNAFYRYFRSKIIKT